MRTRRERATACLIGLLALSACEQVEQVQDRFRDMTPYEAYEASLARAGLAESALARDWVAAGLRAVETPVTVDPPFQEEGFITADEPGAMAYRITVERGQRLTAEVGLSTEEDTRLFVDLFRVPEAPDDPSRPVYSSDSIPDRVVHEPWRGGDFILRIQPELLRGGQYRVTLRLEPQLAFPVADHDVRAVQSIFGAGRDGGRRTHDGVDIFARRGTPVLAASAGRVNRVGLTGLGGKVVWVRDPVRNANIYYAHLDSQLVRDGMNVDVGDTLGLVGNTGNARTTPPHLHFGVYRRGEGPVDPAPFLRPPRTELPELTAEIGRLGSWVRLVNDGIHLRAAPGLRTPVMGELGQYTPLRVLGGSGAFYRVRLPDGRSGYVAAHLTEPVDRPLDAHVAVGGRPVLLHPNRDAPVLARLDEGVEVPVLGRYQGYLYVSAPGGRTGWLAEGDQQ